MTSVRACAKDYFLSGFPALFILLVVFRGNRRKMEELKEINFQALIEGQDYEKALKKIVSRSLFKPSHSNASKIPNLQDSRLNVHTNMYEPILIIVFVHSGLFYLPLYTIGGAPHDRTMPKEIGQGI